MSPTAAIAVLHTSLLFVNPDSVINEYLDELAPDARVLHFVDSDVLAAVVRDGEVSPASTQRMVHLAQAAEAAGADVIFSACSSVGPAIDVARRLVSVPIVKIDDAMTASAVETADAVGVLATVPTTLPPTRSLVEEKARAAGRDITVQEQLCEGAFSVLMSGDRDRHDAMVLHGARALATEVDVIVLAQASMARLAPAIAEAVGKPVLSSPRSGAENAVHVLNEQTAEPVRAAVRAFETVEGQGGCGAR
ncbi:MULTISPECIES: aspartate/glutamate racemase family protein [Streptomyces]|uniref:Aspartate/glutamate racemase family protein n=1 Tax=Streptomyces caniscabiei TaxID=2746961 RepID=A0ABU4MQM4_9ACTN|nr:MULTISPECIES: aspartate/glutamate racemase family protein [Streptomyces]MBE4734223.1 Asp/Glu/hydantoin racemase [Streptomyces caniscabiei]MBE4759169.1 Asp/Glu/hydantoin racemase [Streptomyces caniscabiei]MBE4773234.1 Asp/Glu/hydantoin racemase [Streptomyces caniscabiei]MBE4783621.1 Asp/Glu/hydantoin racemase [Streptomyces caniscabiei]MBE4792925.1 Asp/Glu/hydantoin racemase [Streptomyces caniscabiei]